MVVVIAVILAALLVSMILIGIMIYGAQKRLDAPYGGVLVVEKNEGEPTGVYFQALSDPGNLTDGQDLKLKVRVLEDSQG